MTGLMKYREDIAMKNRLMIVVSATALMLVFAGASLAETASGDPGNAAVAVAAADDLGSPSITKHVNSDGEQVVCIAEGDFQKIMAWYKAEMAAQQQRAQFDKDLDDFEVDP